MKRTIVLLLAAAMLFGLAACGAKENKDNAGFAGMPNPVHEATAESILNDLGFSFTAPADAEDVSFHVIDMSEGDPIAEMSFTRGGVNWNYRMRAALEYSDVSGMYYEWKNSAKASVGYNEAQLSWNEGEAGIIGWYDVAPGLLYSLSAGSGAGEEMLSEMANSLYCPVQGEVDGSFTADFADVLDSIAQNYYPGTAGCSLKARAFAAELADVFTAAAPSPSEVSAAQRAYRESLSEADAAEFGEKLAAVAAASKELFGSNSAELLEECGYAALFSWDPALMQPLFAALTAA